MGGPRFFFFRVEGSVTQFATKQLTCATLVPPDAQVPADGPQAVQPFEGLEPLVVFYV